MEHHPIQKYYNEEYACQYFTTIQVRFKLDITYVFRSLLNISFHIMVHH